VHIVTKILIVFGAILTILLSALTISYAASETRVREDYKNVVAQKDRAQKEVQIAQAESSEKRSALAIAKDAAESAKADLEQQIKRLQQERAELIAKAKEAELAADAAKNQVAGLGESAKVNSTLIKSLTDEVSSLRKAQLEASKRETDLVDRLNDIESQKQVLEQTARALQEQLAEARLALEQAKSSGAGTAIAAVAVEAVGPRISARIVKLDKFPSGDDLAEINLGSAQGLKENQKLNIVRGDKFVASLILTKVDAQRSVGRIDRLGTKNDPQVDDLVLNRLD
jgi:hypothetical protein